MSRVGLADGGKAGKGCPGSFQDGGVMKILYYSWEHSYYDTEQMFLLSGIAYKKIAGRLKNYDHDLEMENLFLEELAGGEYDFIFTFDYFPVISRIARRCGVKYVAWIYDCPHFTLYSKTIVNACNYIFCFDRMMCEQVEALGGKHVFYMPLAVNTRRMDALLGTEISQTEYIHQVAFVGSLYEKNMYDEIRFLPEYLRGYLEGIMTAQQQVWGYSLLEDVLTDSLVQQLCQFVSLNKDVRYLFSDKDFLVDILNKKVTAQERIRYLEGAAKEYPLDLYSSSPQNLSPSCRCHGYIAYEEGMPRVFRQSKINLNITLRSIGSGIPLRCLDIMGAGGFLLSNPQPELCSLFEPGRDFVYFENEADLLEKISYYLQHEEERMEIAVNGWKKVRGQFDCKVQFSKIIETVEEN